MASALGNWTSRFSNAYSYAKTNAINTFLKVGGCFVLNETSAQVSAWIANNISRQTVCLPNVLKHYMPQAIPYFYQTAKKMMEGRNSVCSSFSLDPFSRECLALGAISEELFCRLIIQEGIGKKLPEVLLRTISPTTASNVNHLTMRIIRIASSTIIFTFLHQNKYFMNCDTGAMTVVFFGGLAYGIMQEVTGNVAYPIFIHMMGNLGSTPSLLKQ